ncbi:hypothetical protein Btru_010805 [Bulinus truncatus]|nr:hypothetical protein Btru_010805 [Bulinus truncatus]
MTSSLKHLPFPVKTVVYPEVDMTLWSLDSTTQSVLPPLRLAGQHMRSRSRSLSSLTGRPSSFSSMPVQGKKVDQKNEAEVADDLVLFSSRGNRSSLLTLSQCTGIGPLQKTDRELRGMYQNIVEERRLIKDCHELDKILQQETCELKHKQKQIYKAYKKMTKTLPDADEWLRRRKSHTESWQERERDEIAKRYSRRDRQFRAPPDLKETADKIRPIVTDSGNHFKLPANLFSPDFDETVARLTAHNVRRHSIAAFSTRLPQTSEPLRRMTFGDSDIAKDLQRLRSSLGPRIYLSDLVKQRSIDSEEDVEGKGENL